MSGGPLASFISPQIRTNYAEPGISRVSDPSAGRDTPQASLLAVCSSFRGGFLGLNRPPVATRASADRIHAFVTR
jgi:hypothetical protein